jgi:RIO kinase 1
VEEERVVDMDSLMDEIITAEDEYYERQRASRERDEE